MKDIKINELTVSGEDKNGNPVYQAAGTLEGRDFTARTIQYQGEPIFKLQEEGSHRVMAKSTFNRGDRIAVARACKAQRLELFGAGLKPAVEAQLAAGEVVVIDFEDVDTGEESTSDE